jgi:hypothetical protein
MPLLEQLNTIHEDACVPHISDRPKLHLMLFYLLDGHDKVNTQTHQSL